MKQEELIVTGMTCAACSSAVERNVKKLPGVEIATVNLATEKLNIKFDESIVDIDTIKETIKKIGYGVEESIREVTFPVGGMTCAACSSAVERALKKLPGAKEVSVNLTTEKAKVIYDSNELRLSQIKAAIQKAGYEVLDIDVDDNSTEDRKQKAIKSLKQKFFIALVFTLPLFYISM